MPNGNDRTWVRVTIVVGGFFAKHGHWPSRVRLSQGMLNVLREHLFTPDSWERVTARLEFVVDESAIIAEDDAGNRFDYAERRTADHIADASQWLDVHPDMPYANDL